MKFRPYGCRLLIKPIPRKDSEIIHVINKKPAFKGEVVAIGNGVCNCFRKNKYTRPVDAVIGDIVYVGETPVKFQEYVEDGQKYRIIQECDVALVEEI